MVVSCFAYDCNHTSGRAKCRFFCFPKDPKVFKIWRDMSQRSDAEPKHYSRLCSCHFVAGKKSNGPTIFETPQKHMYRRRKTPMKPSELFAENPSVSERKILTERPEVICGTDQDYDDQLEIKIEYACEEQNANADDTGKPASTSDFIENFDRKVYRERRELLDENQMLHDENAALMAEIENLKRDIQMIANDNVCLKSELAGKQITCDETAALKAEIDKLKRELAMVMNDNMSLRSEMSEKQIIRDEETTALKAEIDKLRREFSMVTNDNMSLRSEMMSKRAGSKTSGNLALDKSGFEGNDGKTNFYTGLPTYKDLKTLYQLVESEIEDPKPGASRLTKFQEFLLVLMRLRVGLLDEDLSYRFGVSRTWAGRLCRKWIVPMALKLSSLNAWPDRDEVHKTYPQCVRDVFGDRFVVILDCVEIFIGLPWFSTHDTTVRCLIGYTPQGSVCYVSDTWTTISGRAQFSELLNDLQPEDIVIPGRNFDLAEELGLHQTSSGFQVFTKSLRQSSFLKSVKTREISFLVETITSRLKRRFRFLQGKMSASFLKPATLRDTNAHGSISYIMTLCCALNNMCRIVELNDEVPT